MEKIRTILTVIASIITILGIFFKITSNLMDELMKVDYENIPGEKTMFQTILKVSSIFLLVFEAIIICIITFGIISDIVNKKIKITENLVVWKETSVAVWIVILLFLISVFGIAFNFLYAHRVYKSKLKGKSNINFSRIKVFLNIVYMIISAAFIISIVYLIYSYLNEKIDFVFSDGFFVIKSTLEKSDIKEIAQLLGMLFFYLIIFMLGFNVFDISNLISKNCKIHIYTKTETVEVMCYIECKKCYIVKEGEKTRFISKSEVSEIAREILIEKNTRVKKNKLAIRIYKVFNMLNRSKGKIEG